MQDYQKKCQLTESLQWNHPDEGILHSALGLMTETVELLNFQNQQNFVEELGDICWYVAIGAAHLGVTMQELYDVEITGGSDNEDYLIAMVTDAGDIVDLLKKSIFYGKPLDHLRVTLLLANILGLVELCADEVNATLDEVMEKNIAKLQKRYPKGKFDAVDSDNRDVKAEMSVI